MESGEQEDVESAAAVVARVITRTRTCDEAPPRANPYRDAWAGDLTAARVGDRASAWPAGSTAAATTAG